MRLKQEVREYNTGLMEFLNRSVSPYHAVDEMKKNFVEQGFESLCMEEEWTLRRGGRYVVDLGTALIAFDIGEDPKSFRILGSHTDSPGFMIKPNPDISENLYCKLNTETYGGPILNTWLDRPLSVAGKVTLKGDKVFEPKNLLVDFEKNVAIIPNLAIHQNREVNKGFELNRQKDMLPLVGLSDEDMETKSFVQRLCDKCGAKTEDVLSYELYLYPREEAEYVGFDDEMISSGRLDNLAMFYVNSTSLMAVRAKNSINMVVGFDNEEVGSLTKNGADSNLLSSVLERIAGALGIEGEAYHTAMNLSFLISCDMAHAVHSNVPEKTDPTNKPKLNRGPVIKMSYNKKYSSDSYSSAVFMQLCEKAKVPVQLFVNRSDQAGGTTIGPISSSKLPIHCVDIGNPMLSMHSVRELMGAQDSFYLNEVLKVFFKED